MAGQVLDGGVNDQQPLLADTVHACRFCASPLRLELIDLGVSPLCERFLRPDQLDEMEPFYPLRVEVCETCFLAQISGLRVSRGDLQRIRLLLVLLHFVARSRLTVRD